MFQDVPARAAVALVHSTAAAFPSTCWTGCQTLASCAVHMVYNTLGPAAAAVPATAPTGGQQYAVACFVHMLCPCCALPPQAWQEPHPNCTTTHAARDTGGWHPRTGRRQTPACPQGNAVLFDCLWPRASALLRTAIEMQPPAGELEGLVAGAVRFRRTTCTPQHIAACAHHTVGTADQQGAKQWRSCHACAVSAGPAASLCKTSHHSSSGPTVASLHHTG